MPNFGGMNDTNKTPGETLDDLSETFRKWGVAEWDVYSERDGRGRRRWQTQGAADLWFVVNGERKTLTCDLFSNFATNLRALYLAADSLRLASQRGILDQYRQFFQALPPGDKVERVGTPYEVLGVAPDASLSVCEAAYRTLAREGHPDAGGSQKRMTKLNAAIAIIREDKRKTS